MNETNLVNVKSLQKHDYAQITREPGSRYLMERQHLFFMSAMGHVKEIKKAPAKQNPDKEAKKPGRIPGDKSSDKRRRYRRRDMEAGQ